MVALLGRAWNRWFAEPLRKVEAESLAYRQSAGRGFDGKTVTVVLTAAVCLMVQNYFGGPSAVVPVLKWGAELAGQPEAFAGWTAALNRWSNDQSSRLLWFALTAFVTYAVVPGLVVTVAFRERLTDYGAGVRGAAADWPVYLAFAAVMIPLVYLCSSFPRFQDVYPFYRVTSEADVGSGLVRWELVYALQFIGLEFFFRGFLVHGTKHRFGAYAVFLMVIPYCMIHFHKPIAECIGSILAGVGLGVVSLVTRSVWPGAALHILVAWGMDLSVLARRGLLH
ncbi:MAG TPA: CPBP family intramembrane glutamic endopeptidase [Urbifossiella sp.]|jgi:membrane protease YdiL (CAAX protease family)|nr:CPBP family intramembrane glutamic endopeptidase [Urbifossiella sp.]